MVSSARSRAPRMIPKYHNLYVCLFLLILFGVIITAAFQFWPHNLESSDISLSLLNIGSNDAVSITTERPPPLKTDVSCDYYSCFEVYHCGYNDETRISVYVYPEMNYLDKNDIPVLMPMSKEFQEIVQTVRDSVYYTPSPEEACVFLPSMDLLNQNNIRQEETGKVLAMLPRWNRGKNHLLFNMLPGSVPDYTTTLEVRTGKAMMAGGGFDVWSYRRGFDISIPVFNPLVTDIKLKDMSPLAERRWLVVATQVGMNSEFRQQLAHIQAESEDFLLLQKCGNANNNTKKYNFLHRCHGAVLYKYPEVMQKGTFCIVVRGSRLGQTALSDALKAGCIPVVVADAYVMPFSEVLDWQRASIRIPEGDLNQVLTTLRKISPTRIVNMRRQVKHFWQRYFSSMRDITLTTLQILNDRVFPYSARSYEQWNDPPNPASVRNPLFLPLIVPSTPGFTAVILTYDRVESLFRVITKVAKVTSLAKILVVWNNQQKSPPNASAWPKIGKPLKVVQTRHNRLSNRFYPYDEIDTEAIFAIDDDIVMLSTDELEFAFQVWREFPDRLVGFPSRLHLWDNKTQQWKYESEWSSQISMVLTGAAFHHKYYSFLYTNSMPGNIKSWVDKNMNCEDIAMNFLVSNVTGKGPIKVTPRKKFKCPHCSKTEMLSADATHMIERSECVTRFTEIYGSLPLKTVEYRADPVLYKDQQLPAYLKTFNDVGSL